LSQSCSGRRPPPPSLDIGPFSAPIEVSPLLYYLVSRWTFSFRPIVPRASTFSSSGGRTYRTRPVHQTQSEKPGFAVARSKPPRPKPVSLHLFWAHIGCCSFPNFLGKLFLSSATPVVSCFFGGVYIVVTPLDEPAKAVFYSFSASPPILNRKIVRLAPGKIQFPHKPGVGPFFRPPRIFALCDVRAGISAFCCVPSQL